MAGEFACVSDMFVSHATANANPPPVLLIVVGRNARRRCSPSDIAHPRISMDRFVAYPEHVRCIPSQTGLRLELMNNTRNASSNVLTCGDRNTRTAGIADGKRCLAVVAHFRDADVNACALRELILIT